MSKYQKVIDTAVGAGKIISRYFGENLEITQKENNPADLLTKADLDSEKHILKELQKHYPGYKIHSEENGRIETDSPFEFIVDPLDGTKNFTLGIPNFTVSIALNKDEQTVFGVVYNPIIKTLYYAERGAGAHLNDSSIRVSKTQEINKSTVAYATGYKGSKIFKDRVRRKLIDLDVTRVLENWSPASDFCLLASGKIEVVINNANEVYDFMAGKLIAREAGAIITDLNGLEESSELNDKFVISNNESVHKEILEVLRSSQREA